MSRAKQALNIVDRPLPKSKAEVRVRPHAGYAMCQLQLESAGLPELARGARTDLNMYMRCRCPLQATTVSLSAYAYLLSELVQYAMDKASSTGELEDRLDAVGYGVGCRLLELLSWRERVVRRKPEVLDMLRFIQSSAWPYLFSKAAEELQQGAQADDEYMIKDHDLLFNKFISVPRAYGGFNPGGAVVAGIVRGLMDAAGFPCSVTAHFSDHPTRPKPVTTILIKLDPQVMQRQQYLDSSRRG